MNTGKKFNWMVWAILILAVLNISTILTIIYNQRKAVQNSAEYTGTESEVGSVQYSGRYFRDYLNLDREQMDRFVEFNPVFRQSVRNINTELARNRQQMLIEMNTQFCDTSRLNALSDSIGRLHSDLKKLTYRYYLDIHDICDEQQREKLKQLFEGILTCDFQMGQRGRGGQGGMNRGRRFNN